MALAAAALGFYSLTLTPCAGADINNATAARRRRPLPPPLLCASKKDSEPGRGFGRSSSKNNNDKTKEISPPKEKTRASQQSRKSTSQARMVPAQAPALGSQQVGKPSKISLDTRFEERLEAIKRLSYEQRKIKEDKEYGAIDYDAPADSEGKAIGFGTKVGVGIAIAVFGLVFALGDFLPSGSIDPSEQAAVVDSKLSKEDRDALQNRLQQFEATLAVSPKDPAALEGAAITLAELGQYPRAVVLLEDLTKVKLSDPDAFRLLGEVKYELKDFEGSAAAYRSAVATSGSVDFDVLRGLTNALLAAKKPDEAVDTLVASRELLSSKRSTYASTTAEREPEKVDPIQVELLLGRAYSDSGRVGDAIAVYDQLINSHPNDFRGYLAMGIILKENRKIGEAERMFIQAHFFAPEKAKAFVDRYSRR